MRGHCDWTAATSVTTSAKATAQIPFLPEVQWAPYLNPKEEKIIMALPAEKVQELKQIIHNHLAQMNMHSKIKEYLDESSTGEDPTQRAAVDEASLLSALRERGIVDDVMRTLNFEGMPERESRRPKERRGDTSEQEAVTRGAVGDGS